MALTLVALFKRRPGMSKGEFVERYETRHRLIGEKVLAGYATRYERRYLNPVDGTEVDWDFDVVMEMDFPNIETFERFRAATADPEVSREIEADEAFLFDRSRMRSYTIENYQSDLPPVAE